ncbi:MAG: HAMP domain-containing histidine kinase [Chitinispirillaceae bacterium]|nr:HAMP domain-containing histidine kinase [Chitinispirillaceae bacterium]
MVNNILRKYGGEIRIESEPGTGTVFIVTFPA